MMNYFSFKQFFATSPLVCRVVFDKFITFIIWSKVSQVERMAIKAKASPHIHLTGNFSHILLGLFQTVMSRFDVDRQRAPLGVC